MVEQTLFAAQAGWLKSAVETLCAAGVEVIAPTGQEEGMVNLTPVTSVDQIASEFVNVRLPLKEVFLPRTEVLFHYENRAGGDVELRSQPTPEGEVVVIGCRPCDAAALEILDKVFHWDYDDAPYRTRRQQTCLLSWACSSPGPQCFCTSVGGGPHHAQGSDVIAFMDDTGEAILQVLTEKGEALMARLGDCVQPAPPGVELPEPPVLERRFDPEKIKTWLDENFESEFWTDVSLACLGCAVCSYLCPTCHCFDIVDEATWNCGERRRNWDCCAFRLFTLHASGHNPRPTQTERCRQRVMHKFKYFPERFGRMACVGCGRCIRNCGVGQDLVSILTEIEAR